MAFSISRKLLRNNKLISSNCPTSAVLFRIGGGNQEQTVSECQTNRRLCKATPPFVIQKAYFHHQNIIQFYIQTAHGILLEALQKSRVNEEKLIEDLNVPDELKRLKAGSLKWLFAVWPTPGKAFSGVSGSINAGDGLNNSLGPSGEGKVPKEMGRHAASSSSDQLHAMVEYLKHKNIAIRRLIKLPWLLAADPAVVEMSVERVRKKLNLEEFSVAISFANLSDSKLIAAAVIWKREAVALSKRSTESGRVRLRNRIDLLAYDLKCPKEDVSDMMAKVNHLMTTPLDKVEATLTCLLEGGVKPDGIINDPWVFIHNLSKMRSRIHALQEEGIHDFKPWVLRTPQRHFERYLAKVVEEQQLLASHKNVKSFLQEKLKCDQAAASIMLSKVPSLKTATATKLNEMIEFLFSAGFTARQIRETPRILGHSVETISERLSEVSAFGKQVINLHLLCRTSKEYRAALRKLKTLSTN